MQLKAYLSERRGRSMRLALELGAPQSLISQWFNGRRQIPAKRCPAIEKATGGAVTCEEMRPDVDWAYLRGDVAKETVGA